MNPCGNLRLRDARPGPAVITLFTALALGGCATIVGSSTQPLSVNAVCEGQLVTGAKCTLANDKGRWDVTTPGTATVHKAYKNLTVDCSYGASTGRYELTSMSNASFANVLGGGVPGYAIDSATGKGFDYPASVTVVLQPPCSSNTGSTP